MAVFVAGSVIPVGAALKAGEPVTRAFIAGVGKTSVTTVVGVGTNFVVAPIATSLAKSAGIDPIWANDIGIGTGFATSIFTAGKVYKGGGNGAKIEEIGEVSKGYKYSEFGDMSYQDGKKYLAWNKLREEGITYEQVEEIKGIPKGNKSLPDSYLSDDYISNHLDSFKESGAVKIMPNEPSGTIGGKGGTFVMSRSELNDIIRNANGDVSKIENLLGLDPGYLGKNPVIVTIKDTSSIRIPSGNELGAWPEYWEPGGYTSGGIKEAVVDPVKDGGYIYEHLFK